MTPLPPIPRNALFGNPERISPQLAPDGTRLAWIAPHEGVLNVWTATPGSDDARPVTHDTNRGIRTCFWTPDGARIAYVQDVAGDENWHLYDIDPDTHDIRDLTPFEQVRTQVIGVDLDVQDRILIGLNLENKKLHDVYELRLEDGGLTRVLANPGLVAMVADSDLEVRAAIAARPDGGRAVMVRDKGGPDAPWRPLLEVGHEDSLSTVPLRFDADGARLLLTTSADANTTRLVWVRLADGEREVVAGHPRFDIVSVVGGRRTRQPQMVAFGGDRTEWHVLDPAIAGDLEALRGLDDGDLRLVSRDREDATWLIAYDHSGGPTRFYTFHRPTRTGTYLFSDRPALEDAGLTPIEPFSFTARDGLTIHGYLTFPTDRARRDLPTVVKVHGGPWTRDSWRLDSEAQWLADRGYLCVQVNFRGSTGYGKEFTNAGDREWGGRMHDDLIDGLAWVIERGYADPDRVGIYGGSYGGYAALVGAAFTPDVFRCAVDVVGPSSLATLIRGIPAYWAPTVAQMHTRVGNPETEAEFLWSRSPLSRVDDIRIPLLIVHGANDPRVKQSESEQIVAALRAKGIPHEYLVFPDEGHGMARPENRLRFYACAERFLAAHLGGRFEPEPGDGEG
ncbi:S9 family peptidase [Streptomyces sp. NPDC002205]|uniref:S9 family peptidase n=1 Tax=Streptomyces sp. NPDC002205 TaxID=3154411 RepID=UPI00332B5A33